MQAWRTGLQTRLKGTLSVDAASFVRYFYALPLEFLALLLLLHQYGGAVVLETRPTFLLLCLAGGIAQILGTLFLVRSFHSRGLVTGTAYAKTEAAQLVILTTLFLGAELQPIAIIGIFLALAGVLLLSGQGVAFLRRDFWLGLREPAAGYGLAAALAFALTAIALRAASQHGDQRIPVLALALWMLLVTNTLQTLLQGGYLLLRKPAEIAASLRHWRLSWPIGVLSALGSWAWFSGFALTQVALVRGLGQVDTLLVFFFGHHILRERLGKKEILATLLIVVGALCITLPDLH
ncbi:EamA family transporter [Acidithiobacillus sp. CV18-2]|uniref:EamA family transporter n=1 Tax=Igneacidithiobacillus copahuensis TaxID=2724909 RepID=A0AAE2YR53_9PROT|nr:MULTISPECIES: EamA family transporter [Acidithiobacillaceae]MBU2755184.1 EamA family transporter [Acidithiobacillus sp. CV18-3]MBU2756890.1 EamA family transporter [Acidithiobacillus sp. BN09-2]MBU2778012.1 EamA family transporter [Acidithiobacillus sp. CV18-2]MBU2796636.1 EamA family transporter [Acidithiobacillus sp. VAN18-2]MBU2799601.1 EamA family transporter [Acidithiobacillus sp. VAN18-4]